MKVLVTGGSGFLGSRIVSDLLGAGLEVTLLARRNVVRPPWNHAATVAPFDGAGEAGAIVRAVRPDVILHAASAQGRQGESATAMVEANHVLGIAALDATAAHATTFINFDTALPRSLNAYAFTKYQFREAAKFFRPRTTRLINLRLQTLYGPGDSPTKFTTHVIREFLRGATHLEMTPGRQERDFLHTDDAVRALRVLIDARDALGTNEDIDLGSGQTVPLIGFVELAREAAGARTEIRPCLPYREKENMHMVADIARLAELGWEPRIRLADGIRMTVDHERRETPGGS